MQPLAFPGMSLSLPFPLLCPVFCCTGDQHIAISLLPPAIPFPDWGNLSIAPAPQLCQGLLQHSHHYCLCQSGILHQQSLLALQLLNVFLLCSLLPKTTALQVAEVTVAPETPATSACSCPQHRLTPLVAQRATSCFSFSSAQQGVSTMEVHEVKGCKGAAGLQGAGLHWVCQCSELFSHWRGRARPQGQPAPCFGPPPPTRLEVWSECPGRCQDFSWQPTQPPRRTQHSMATAWSVPSSPGTWLYPAPLRAGALRLGRSSPAAAF